RDEHVDRTVDVGAADLAERPRQRVDHVGQAAGLGPWLSLGGDEGDAHAHRGRVCPRATIAVRNASLNRFTRTSERLYHRGRMEPTVRIPSAAPSHVRVPPELERWRRLAYNLYWSWHPQARALFARINGGVWARIH